MNLAGAWKHISDEGINAIKKGIEELRKRSTKELMEQDDLH